MNSTTQERPDDNSLEMLDRCLGIMRESMMRKTPSGERGAGQSGSIAMAQAFLNVCLNEGRSLSEIAESGGQPISTMSRHLLDLGPRDRNRNEGLKLVDQTESPDDARRRIYTLTPNGKLLKSEISKALES